MTNPIGPDFIALQVRDLAASRTFYENTFGFQPVPHSPPGAVVFDTQPIPLAIREPLHTLPGTGPLGTGLVLWIACPDADALHAHIVAKGGTVVGSPADGPFGRFFVAKDPDGYPITFHTARP